MKEEKFLECMNFLDPDLIEEAAREPNLSKKKPDKIDRETFGDHDDHSEKIDRETFATRRNRILKAAVAVVAVGTAGLMGVHAMSLNQGMQSDTELTAQADSVEEGPVVTGDNPDTRNNASQYESTAASSSAGTEEEKDAEKADTGKTKEEQREALQAEGVKRAEEEKTDTEEPESDPTEETSTKTETGETSGTDNAATVGSSGKSNSSDKNSSGSGQQKTDGKTSTKSSSEKSVDKYQTATLNGVTYNTDAKETDSSQVDEYLGSFTLSAADGSTISAKAYSVSGVGKDHEIAVQIGDDDQLYSYVSTGISATGSKKSDSTSTNASNGTDGSGQTSVNSTASNGAAGTESSTAGTN